MNKAEVIVHKIDGTRARRYQGLAVDRALATAQDIFATKKFIKIEVRDQKTGEVITVYSN